MRLVCLCVLAAQLAAGQVPRISVIDFFGVRGVSTEKLRAALQARAGDPLPPSKESVEERLEKVDGVVSARLEAVCCDAGGAVLFVGVEEKGAPHFDLRNAPAGAAALPPTLVQAYGEFVERRVESARAGEDREDLVRDYVFSADPVLRRHQEYFVEFAESSGALLKQVILEASSPEQRAIAAYLIAYANDKQAAVDALQDAVRDPVPEVRRAALGALHAIAVYALRHPEAGVRISPTWAVEMLHSVVWSDRVRAVDLLVTLTETGERPVLSQIRERALPSLIEMARWQSLKHALPAYMLAGRVAGVREEVVRKNWDAGERETVLSSLSARDSRSGGKR